MKVSINTGDPRPIYLQIMDEVRRALAGQVARRALIEAHRNGLDASELIDAIDREANVIASGEKSG